MAALHASRSLRPGRTRSTLSSLLVLACICGAAAPAPAVELAVVSTDPPRSANNVPLYRPISVTFNQPVLRSSFTPANFWAFGHSSGTVPGTISFSNGDQTVTLTPSRRYSAGEPVLIILSNALRAADNSPIRAAGYSYRFWTRAYKSTAQFAQFEQWTSHDASNAQTRIYGAQSTDLNEDGWMDLALVNEVSADLRVFLNDADSTGSFGSMLAPPSTLNFESSANESGDFNHDGHADICTTSSATSVLSVLLGNGNGTFAPQQAIPVGGDPHGVAVMDFDGDGDLDIATSNTAGNNITLLRNNGAGVFAVLSSFDGGGSGEYALGAADMNNDGIMDLIVGNRSSQTVVTFRGNGNGTFTFIRSQICGGQVWQLTTGDVNGDGNEDVATANSGSGNCTMLLGLGDGTLQTVPQVLTVGGHTVATDLGDFDGDGDLDWLLSSYGGGHYRAFRNNGAGTFAFWFDIDAPSNPACAVLFDIDNDRDIDICMLDEIADLVTLMKNNGTTTPGDMNCDGAFNNFDIDPFVVAILNPSAYVAQYPSCNLELADINADGFVNNFDIDPFVAKLLGP